MLSAILRPRALPFRIACRPPTAAPRPPSIMAPKRKRSARALSSSSSAPISTAATLLPPKATPQPVLPLAKPSTRRASSRSVHTAAVQDATHNPQIFDGINALRASPDAEVSDRFMVPTAEKRTDLGPEPGDTSNQPDEHAAVKKRRTGTVKKEQASAAAASVESTPSSQRPMGDAVAVDPELVGEEDVSPEELEEALGRPPPVNSGYLPLPWKGRLGYACLNTYLRTSNPPVFSSRTCRIASILEHRHPLSDPTQPEHATKNRPDKSQPASIERGRRYVEAIGLANARDIIKMIRWNDKYGIKFMRLSSEMFPFASHEEYGYKLAPFASEALADAGKVIAELGHRVTTHPGQFTQLGSPRKSVIENAIRDLDYHDEMLSLLRLPDQMNKDAVMILHMGGVFGDKQATLDRFRENYARLSQSVKNRLVLENDDVSWTVHDLLPICHELNIPLVLDYHHHNIMFDSTKLREGTLDIMELYDEIAGTWKRKGITQKMHYSEPTPAAITGRQRRKHSPRVMTLPPCAPNMDLMIEAKDKEQAVFELMRTFKLPGFDSISDVIPYQRNDESKAAKPPKKKPKKRKAAGVEEEAEEKADLGTPAVFVSEEDTGMGGPDGRVYWPPGMEEWLKPPKRIIKKKDDADTPAKKTPVKGGKKKAAATATEEAVKVEDAEDEKDVQPTPAKKTAAKKTGRGKAKAVKAVPTPSTSEGEESLSDLPGDLSEEEVLPVKKRGRPRKSASPPALSRRGSTRTRAAKA